MMELITLEEQIEVVVGNPCFIKFIKNPYKEVIDFAVANYPRVIDIISRSEIRIGCKTKSLDEWLSLTEDDILELDGSKLDVYAMDMVKDKLRRHFKPGELLKGVRLREGLTQLAIGKKLNVTKSGISEMENGKRPINIDTAQRIEKVFNVSYKSFLQQDVDK